MMKRSAASKMMDISKGFVTPFTSSHMPTKDKNDSRTKTVQVDIGDHIYIEANNGSVEEVLRELHSGGTNVTGKALADRHGRMLPLKNIVDPGQHYQLVDRRETGEKPNTKRQKGNSTQSDRASQLTMECHRTLKEILNELKFLKNKVATIEDAQRDMYRLLKETKKEISPAKPFDLDKTPYANQLQTSLATKFLTSLIRDVDEDTLQAIILNILDKRDIGDPLKVQITLKWCKKKLTTFRVDERRKVLGIKPFESFPLKGTDTLARDMIRSLKGPIDLQVQRTYQRNLTLLRKFVRDNNSVARTEGKLYINFREWVQKMYKGEPSPLEWQGIIHEDNTQEANEREMSPKSPLYTSPRYPSDVDSDETCLD